MHPSVIVGLGDFGHKADLELCNRLAALPNHDDFPIRILSIVRNPKGKIVIQAGNSKTEYAGNESQLTKDDLVSSLAASHLQVLQGLKEGFSAVQSYMGLSLFGEEICLPIHIYIIADITEITGSSLLLPVSMLINSLAEIEQQLEREIGFKTIAALSIAIASDDTKTLRERVKETLLTIDDITTHPTSESATKIRSFLSIEGSECPPFSHCYLIDNINEKGRAISRIEILNQFVNFCYISSLSSFTQKIDERLSSVQSQNVPTYSSQGNAVITLPLEQLRKYCYATLDARFIDEQILHPVAEISEDKIGKFIQKIKELITVNKWVKEATDNLENVEIYNEDTTAEVRYRVLEPYFGTSYQEVRTWPDILASHEAFLRDQRIPNYLGKIRSNFTEIEENLEASISHQIDQFVANPENYPSGLPGLNTCIDRLEFWNEHETTKLRKEPLPVKQNQTDLNNLRVAISRFPHIEAVAIRGIFAIILASIIWSIIVPNIVGTQSQTIWRIGGGIILFLVIMGILYLWWWSRLRMIELQRDRCLTDIENRFSTTLQNEITGCLVEVYDKIAQKLKEESDFIKEVKDIFKLTVDELVKQANEDMKINTTEGYSVIDRSYAEYFLTNLNIKTLDLFRPILIENGLFDDWRKFNNEQNLLLEKFHQFNYKPLEKALEDLTVYQVICTRDKQGMNPLIGCTTSKPTEILRTLRNFAVPLISIDQNRAKDSHGIDFEHLIIKPDNGADYSYIQEEEVLPYIDRLHFFTVSTRHLVALKSLTLFREKPELKRGKDKNN